MCSVRQKLFTTYPAWKEQLSPPASKHRASRAPKVSFLLPVDLGNARRGKPGSVSRALFLAQGAVVGWLVGAEEGGSPHSLRCLSLEAVPRKCGRGDRMTGPE